MDEEEVPQGYEKTVEGFNITNKVIRFSIVVTHWSDTIGSLLSQGGNPVNFGATITVHARTFENYTVIPPDSYTFTDVESPSTM